jgi:4-hydroxyphenylpyruvate dioxygenase
VSRTTTAHEAEPIPGPGSDPMPLHGIDHLELVVGNANQAAHFLERTLGFTRIAYAGLETGVRDRVAHVLRQGRVRIVVTGALGADSELADHHRRHGDAVRTIALGVPDAEGAFRHAIAAGARIVSEPQEHADPDGTAVVATIAAYGDIRHTFVQRGDYDGAFLPGYEAVPAPPGGRAARADEPLLIAFDHVVGNVERGTMDAWVSFYERVLGMTEMVHFSDEAIHTEYSALMSKVLEGGRGLVKFPINEPAQGKRRSQIDEFLQFNEGPGVQHIALATRDIVAAVDALEARGVRFVPIPDSYYDDLPERIPEVAGQLADLRRLGILVDHDDEGHLLQIFTAPFGDRPTLFLELIERRGARGFGNGNFRALFEALEREQDRRGNL